MKFSEGKKSQVIKISVKVLRIHMWLIPLHRFTVSKYVCCVFLTMDKILVSRTHNSFVGEVGAPAWYPNWMDLYVVWNPKQIRLVFRLLSLWIFIEIMYDLWLDDERLPLFRLWVLILVDHLCIVWGFKCNVVLKIWKLLRNLTQFVFMVLWHSGHATSNFGDSDVEQCSDDNL